jgi:nitroreductase
MLSAAAWSPSGSNIQPWNTYVLTGALNFGEFDPAVDNLLWT